MKRVPILWVSWFIHYVSYSPYASIFRWKLCFLQIQKFSLDKQIELFQGTQELIRGKIGERAADKFFKEGRYVVALGSNDFINNYLMPVYRDSWTYNDDTFMDYLTGTLERQLKVYLVCILTQLSFLLFLHLIIKIFSIMCLVTS